MPNGIIWDLAPHTAAKHELLRRYLGAWFPIMARWNGRILYIDGFAGPGEYSRGEHGSPIIALETAIQHHAALQGEIVFLFVEKDGDRAEHLQALVEGYTLPEHVTVLPVEVGAFDEHMTGVFEELDEQRHRLAPTFALIDPFGFSDTPMSVVAKIMGHERCEVLITFMYEYVNRFLDHPSPKIDAHYDLLFGTDAWREGRKLTNPAARRRFIHDLYRDQLVSAAGVRYVRSFEMINDGNRTR